MINKFTAKILIVGEASCGKTSLVDRYVNGFYYEGVQATIGVDFRTKTLNMYDSQSKKRFDLTFQIWDTAGQERFNAIVSQFFRNVDAIILVFDLTDPETLDKIDSRWLPQINYWCPETTLVLVGNKSEMNNISSNKSSTIATDVNETLNVTAKKLAEAIDIGYFSCSAKTGEGVKEIFNHLAEKIVDQKGIENMIQSACSLTLLQEEPSAPKSKACYGYMPDWLAY